MSAEFSLPRDGVPSPAAKPSRWPLRVLAIDSTARLSVDPADAALNHGIELSPYSDGLAALLGMSQEDPDVILAPTDMRSVGLIPFIDAVVAWSDIPVIVGVGAHPDAAELASRAVEHGARSLLALPFRAADLLLAIRNVGFTSHRDRPARVLSAGPIVLDPQAFRATADGVVVPLSLREFQLLHYLLAHSCEILSPAKLAQECGENGKTSTDAVRTSMSRLRDKLEQACPGAGRHVETVIGFGYRLRDAA